MYIGAAIIETADRTANNKANETVAEPADVLASEATSDTTPLTPAQLRPRIEVIFLDEEL
jgi:hypothetical protein